ncbi:MAG: hypothetical protein ABI599_03865 [Flavobacteriales bacterium]
MKIPRNAWCRGGAPVQWTLFIAVMATALIASWQVHSNDPLHFLRQQSDNQGYYQWLPGVIIDHNIDRMYWQYQLPNGNWLSLFTFGVALLQLPFFLLGHVWAMAFGYPLDGFSEPYAVTNMISSAFYAALGCVLAYRLARRYSGWPYAAVATVLIFIGTNLLYYSSHEGGMSHSYSFFLMGLFAWCTLRVQDGPRRIHVAGWVLGLGLLVLVRQLNVIAVLFALLFAMASPGGVRRFVRHLVMHPRTLIISGLVAAVPFVLMMLYWHRISGSYLLFTYGQKGEHFEWDRMVPGRVLTDIRNGWFVYTPVMVPVVAWLLWGTWKGWRPARGILVVLALTWLIYSAWWCWFLGSGFSHRGFVDLYALLAIPMAWMLRSLWRGGLVVRALSSAVLVLLLWYNLGLTERFTWHWSQEDWTWERFADQVGDVFAGRYEPVK